MTIARFAAAPFHLDQVAQDWVAETLSRLSSEDRLRQLFTLICFGDATESIELARSFRPGGITRMFAGNAKGERALISDLNASLPTPLLVSADLEGSRMSLSHGAQWPNPLALSAIDDLAVTEQVTQAMALEALASGINWSFTPVLDINHAFRSAIVATRAFGSDVDTIERHALLQMEVFQRNGIASAVKHFPGEGFDDRDQHLVTTTNPLSIDEWTRTFGRLYRGAIERGALSVMSAHISFPAYVEANAPGSGIEAYRPGSISKLLNQTLLREELGFDGLIVSDATAMAGLGAWSKRAEHLPELIANGCDIILFSDDPDADLQHLKDALADGRLMQERVDDAVARQLALKAALGLHLLERTVPSYDTVAHQELSASVARRAPTLVKDVQNLLPLSVETHKRILVFTTGINMPFMPDPLPFALPELLQTQGFEITIFEPSMTIEAGDFDLILYLFGDETLLTRGHIFLDWLKTTGSFGNAMKRYWHETPCAMISFGYPYLLYDAPRMPTSINAYSTTETMQKAVVDLLVGKAEWNMNSPVDPFCGLQDARY